jgi:rfaE bifunctional protein nucleotidyltransferase chain/domain
MGKVIEFDLLAEELNRLREKGNIIVLCHGCFDLMHPGHIKHFQSAKKMGHILVVTVTPDRYVDKGPERPVYSQELRAESIAALECVDFTSVNKWPTAEETLRRLKPDIYVKGQEFEKGEDKTGKIQRELDVVTEIGCKMNFTHEIVFSSTELLKKYF